MISDDLLQFLSRIGIPVPVDLESRVMCVWGRGDVRWVFDPTATENSFVLRLYVGKECDIAFTPSGAVARAICDGRILSDEAAIQWIEEHADALA